MDGRSKMTNAYCRASKVRYCKLYYDMSEELGETWSLKSACKAWDNIQAGKYVSEFEHRVYEMLLDNCNPRAVIEEKLNNIDGLAKQTKELVKQIKELVKEL